MFLESVDSLKVTYLPEFLPDPSRSRLVTFRTSSCV